MKTQLLIFVLLSTFSLPVFTVDLSTPTGRVQDSIEKVIDVLKDRSLDREARWEKVGVIIDDSFDFRSMSQSVLASNWKKATPEERKRFVEFFSQYIEDTYRNKIEAYTDQEVTVKGETIRGKRAIVETVIVTDTTVIPVNYKLKNNNGTWYAYDIVIEGVSLVNNYRSTFAAVVKNEGMEGLMDDIQRRIRKHRQMNEGDPSGSNGS
ncbi:MAG: ABC transporter substrate-binding protein [Gammaproteobacteria bacterium]